VREDDVFDDGEVFQESGVLGDVSDRALPKTREIGVDPPGETDSVAHDLAAGGLHHAREEGEECRFSAPPGPCMREMVPAGMSRLTFDRASVLRALTPLVV